MKDNKPDTEQGFTLVEMLVVLAVIGLMSGLMLVMMGQFRNVIRLDNTISEQAALQKTANYIASQLEQAEALPLDSRLDGRVEPIQATGNTIRFLAVSGRSGSTLGFSEYSYVIEKNNGIDELVEQRRPRRKDIAVSDKIVLLENISDLSFSFLQTASTALDQSIWLTTWQNKIGLPQAVRIGIQKRLKSGAVIEATAIAYIGR